MKRFSLFFILLLVVSVSNAGVTELKQEISVLSKANTNEIQNQKQVREELDKLVAELVQLAPQVTEQDWATYSPGSWRQIWSDEADNSPEGTLPRQLDKIFQYVTPEGRAVNFGERTLPNGSKVTFALEAVGAVSGNVQNTKILNAFSRGKGLESGEYLSYLADDILSGDLQEFNGVKAGVFPEGPIGAESDLTILYLDQDMKIGTAPNVYTGASEMFVLERIVSVQ